MTSAPLSSVLVAQGVVAVESKRKVVQHLEGGVVSKIYVADGDHVEKGEVLVRLDGVPLRAALDSLQPILASREAEEARLRSERLERSSLDLPNELLEAASHSKKIQRILDEQREIFQTRRRKVDAIRREAETEVRRLKEKIDTLGGIVEKERTRERVLQQEFEDLEGLYRDGYLTRARLRGVRAERDAVALNVRNLEAEVAELQNVLSGEIISGEKKIIEVKEEVAQELFRVEREVLQLREREKAIRDRYQRLVVKAPVSGFIVGLMVHTERGVVPPGGKILEIVPSDDKFVVEARIAPRDIDVIRTGMSAEIKFVSLTGQMPISVRGDLVKVSADLVERETVDPHYQAQLHVKAEEVNRLARVKLVPGMPAEVVFQRGTLTPLRYFVGPVMRLFNGEVVE